MRTSILNHAEYDPISGMIFLSIYAFRSLIENKNCFLHLTFKNFFYSGAKKTLKLNERFSDAEWHVAENTKAHHTDEYSRTDKSLVLRRGQSFKVNYFSCNKKVV